MNSNSFYYDQFLIKENNYLMSKIEKKRVIVIGAGLSGLSAAREILSNCFDV
jgi:hypothetical protein